MIMSTTFPCTSITETSMETALIIWQNRMIWMHLSVLSSLPVIFCESEKAQ